MAALTFILIFSLLIWISILLLPWRPWFIAEAWDADKKSIDSTVSLNDITVLIPARNEEKVIKKTLMALAKQGVHLNVILVDDNSDDDTSEVARSVEGLNLNILQNRPLKKGWSGKLWALENGRRRIKTPFTLLLDADIEIDPGVISGLKQKLTNSKYSFISLMARPSLRSFWERLLMPAFIYFFKLLYPFRIANSTSSWISAAAGGCILMETKILDEIGGFVTLKETLIDDCTLARKVKEAGYNTWLGLTHSVKSIRPYSGFTEIWNMVARTAYTQLHYSLFLLLLCTILMLSAYITPLIGLLLWPNSLFWMAFSALVIMFITYLPTLRYYHLSPLWALSMPFVGALFLGMTWTSAVRYWSGERMRWRGRIVTD